MTGRGDAIRAPLLTIALALLCFASVSADAQTRAPTSSQPAAPTISIEPAADAAIGRRIETIFRNIEELREIDVSVQGGIVRLTGDVTSPAERERAGNLARRIEGVVDVRNDLKVGDDIAASATRVYSRLATRLSDYLLYLPVVVLALLVFLLFWLVARWIASSDRLYRRVSPNRFVRQLAAQTVRTIVVILGLVVALEIVDATPLIGAVLGAAGLTGLVIGFALKETVENYVAGVLLSLRQPFSPHDHVLIEGYEGRVVRLTARATVLLTLDGNHVRIPNAVVFKGIIVNYTRNPERRFDFAVGLATDTELLEAQRVAAETVRSVEGVLDDPAPDAWVAALGESSISLFIVGWVDQHRHSFPKVRGEAIRRVAERLAEVGIDMPEPIYRVNLSSRQETPEEPTARAHQPRRVESATPDLSPDTYLDREIANERAQMAEEDLLDRTAPKE